jgi:hypothetical protein
MSDTCSLNAGFMMRVPALAVAAALLSCPAAAQDAPVAAALPAPPYADIADLVLASPVVVDATIRSAAKLKGAEAANLAPGATRYYVTADVGALIRAPGGLPPRIGYLLDVSASADGRAPKLRKQRVLLFARPVAGAGDQLQLVNPRAQQPWTPAADARVRQVVREVVASDAPPVVTGVGNAFHVAGSLPGEGETQIFLQTADSRPVSLSVLRRPGEQPRYAVALSEIVDDAAGPPPRDTLLWYRLACALPAALPARSTAALEPADAEQARVDYRFVREQLGACGRSAG